VTDQKKKKKCLGPGKIAHTYNPSYSGGRDLKIVVQVQPRQKVIDTSSQPIRQILHIYNSSYQEGMGRRIEVQE
jgi:hypothetical protein